MAGPRYLHLLIPFTVCFLHVPGVCLAQTPQPAASQQTFTQPQPGRRPGLTGESPNAPEFENARRAIESLTPEQRKRFQENILRWMNLTKEEKEMLREREEWRKEVMAQEVERAIKQSGLSLDPARRELFAKRYAEERRALEMQLRKDMEEKRRPLVQALIGRLRQEFSTNPPSTPPTPSPGAAP